MNRPWYTNAIVYSLDVDTFLDSGYDTNWLLPFYPSPQTNFEGASVVFLGNPSQSSFETLSPYEYNWILMPNK